MFTTVLTTRVLGIISTIKNGLSGESTRQCRNAFQRNLSYLFKRYHDNLSECVQNKYVRI